MKQKCMDSNLSSDSIKAMPKCVGKASKKKVKQTQMKLQVSQQAHKDFRRCV